jgi:hypothetical protein
MCAHKELGTMGDARKETGKNNIIFFVIWKQKIK